MDADEHGEYDERELVKLVTVEDPVAASALIALLEDQGIRSLLEPWHSTALNGIFVSQKGHAVIKVFREDLAAARAVLEDFRKGVSGAEETEPPDSAT
jgi:hypothetical protein